MPKTSAQRLALLLRKWAQRTALPPRRRPTAWELALDAAWQAREGAIQRELRERSHRREIEATLK